MSIVAAFGDDDHTAADGPYVRVLKVRKWLYVLSTCAFLLSLRLYDPDAVKSLLRVVSLPSWLLIQTTLIGSIYLLTQYGLLCGQLARTYDIILDERLTFRRAEELTRASEKIEQARSARESFRQSLIERAMSRHRNAVARMAAAEDQRANALAHLNRDLSNLSPADAGVRDRLNDAYAARLAEADTTLINAHRELDEATAEMQQRTGSGQWYGDDPQGQMLTTQLEDAQRDFERLKEKDPAGRPGYRKLEIAVDVIRIAAPPITTCVSILSLFRLVL